MSNLVSDEIVDKFPPISELLRLLFGYRFHRRACRRLIVLSGGRESNQNWNRTDGILHSGPHELHRWSSYTVSGRDNAEPLALGMYVAHASATPLRLVGLFTTPVLRCPLPSCTLIHDT